MNIDELFFIAELSANHNNDLDHAIKTIEAFAKAGASAIKVQTYTADSLTLNVENEYFGTLKQGLWKGRTLYDLYTEGSLPYEWHEPLKNATEALGMVFFSSPFAVKDVDFLESIGCPIYKIASFEINHIPLIEKVALTGKPIIMSTGVATLDDIELALDTCYGQGNKNITLLKCTSEYPASIEDANLKKIQDIKERFKVNVGVSDHTIGYVVPMTAVALGARVIEKHVTLDREKGLDASFSMLPDEFEKMVTNCKLVNASLGKVSYDVSSKDHLRKRSIFVAKDIEIGENFSNENLRIVRPGHGMHPKYLKEYIGDKSNKSYKKGTCFRGK